MKSTNVYKTKDLAEAAVLLVKGKRFLGIDRDSQVCWFIFKGKEECQKLANDYLFGDCQVNARSYFEEMKKLKNLIFRE